MKRILLAALIASLCWSVSAQAGPAPWYYWESLMDGRLICANVNPGSGWRKHSGPYDNGGCRAF
nr:hypothetical protein [Pseudomonas sp. NEEL19]